MPPTATRQAVTVPWAKLWSSSAASTRRPLHRGPPTVGHQAADAISALSSPAARDRLRILNTVLELLHTSPDVAELRDRLTSSTAA